MRTTKWPRLARCRRGRHLPNASVCDGYGAASAHALPSARASRSRAGVERAECSAGPLVPPPRASFVGVSTPPRDVLLVTSQHNNHGLFAQVERVLNQLHLAGARGLVPHVFLGRKAFASPTSCEVGENQYFDAAAGPNVWEYYFEPVSSYRGGNASLDGRPCGCWRYPTRTPGGTRSGATRTPSRRTLSSTGTTTSSTPCTRAPAGRPPGQRVAPRAPALLAEAAALPAPWRRRSSHLLGAHLRGTDKVTHPKVPSEVLQPHIDAYTKRHSDALIVLCTDDQSYHAAVIERYGAARVVSRGAGYATKNVAETRRSRRSARARRRARRTPPRTPTSSPGHLIASEFALWYNPDLITEHLDSRSPAWPPTRQRTVRSYRGRAAARARLRGCRRRELGGAAGREDESPRGGGAAAPSTAAAARTPPRAVRRQRERPISRAAAAEEAASDRLLRDGRDRVATVSGWRRRGGGRRGAAAGGGGATAVRGGARAGGPSQPPPLAPGLPRQRRRRRQSGHRRSSSSRGAAIGTRLMSPSARRTRARRSATSSAAASR